jgi:hypothetical protein
MTCKYCGKPVVLIPSAAERAQKDVTGKTAQYYRDLFPDHAACVVAERSRQSVELMRSQNGTKRVDATSVQ